MEEVAARAKVVEDFLSVAFIERELRGGAERVLGAAVATRLDWGASEADARRAYARAVAEDDEIAKRAVPWFLKQRPRRRDGVAIVAAALGVPMPP